MIELIGNMDNVIKIIDDDGIYRAIVEQTAKGIFINHRIDISKETYDILKDLDEEALRSIFIFGIKQFDSMDTESKQLMVSVY